MFQEMINGGQIPQHSDRMLKYERELQFEFQRNIEIANNYQLFPGTLSSIYFVVVYKSLIYD
jgi:hypothetical protein